MKPYTPNTKKGRVVGGHDIHHKTADQPKAAAKHAAKAMRHAARQDARFEVLGGIDSSLNGTAGGDSCN